MSVARGANSLINVGPDGSGKIPEPAKAVFADIGAWMETNGEAIYGTEPTPYDAFFEWGEITVKDNRLYLHILDRSQAEVTLPLLAVQIKSASILGSSQTVRFEQSGDTATVTLPEIEGVLPYVICLQCDAPVTLRSGGEENIQ
jgi:alpha-L-fucosidase